MKRKYIFLLLIGLSLLLLCTLSKEQEATKASTTSIRAYDTAGVIETSEQELLSYFENHKVLFTALSVEFLKVEASDKNISSVQAYVGENRVDLFTNAGVSVLDFSTHKKLEQLLSALELEPSPIQIISAASDTLFFSGRTCSFGHTLYVDGAPYFDFELVYCENTDAIVGFPEITKQVEKNWYIVGYNYE